MAALIARQPSYHQNHDNSALSNYYNQSYNAYNNNNKVKNPKTQDAKCKISPSRRLKNLLKPLLGRVFKSKARQAKRNSYCAYTDKEAEFEWLNNEMDNRANEHLEQRLIEELHMCDDGAAIIVYNEDGTRCVESVDKEDLYVPVHFARTNAGTFFWTSMQRETIQPYDIQWNFMDRWAQA